MKKLLVFAIASCLGIMANGASLNWGAALCESDGATEMSAGQVAYLIWSDTAFSGLASSFDKDAMTTDNGGTAVTSYTITADDASGWGFTSTFSRADADGGVNGYYQMLILNTTGDKFAIMDMGSLTGISDSTGAGNLNKGPTVDWGDSSTWLGGSGYVGTVTGGGGIPEPTSGLLLLIGGSLLALRRKQK